MRRRGKRGPNDSESTGKIGHEVPQGQPAPLRPVYPDEPRGSTSDGGGSDSGAAAVREAERAEAPSASAPDVAQASNSEGERSAGRGQRRSAAGRLVGKLMHGRGKAAAQESKSGNRSAAGSNKARGGGRPGPRPEKSGAEKTAGATIPAAADARGAEDAAPQRPSESPAGGKLVVETQPESPSVAPPEAPAVSVKNPKGYVVLAIGLPGSGKTTWFKRRGVAPLSSDMLRSILFDDIGEQRYQGLVFSTLRSLLRARLIAKMPWNYVDATNLSPHERRQWIKMARSFGYEVQAVFFDVPFEVCMERNSRRDRLVSEDSMRKMAERLRPPSFQEGFSKITMVRVKGAAAAKLEESGEVERAGE